MTKNIPLSNGKYAVIDGADHVLVGNRKWHMHSNGYAATTKWDGEHNNVIFMHRLILGLCKGDGISVDHINRDGLDNRRVNLRAVTHGQNCQNRNPFPKTKSGYRGVSWDRARNCWRAHYMLNGRQVLLGRFVTIEEAAIVVARARASVMGHTNEPLLLSLNK